MQSSKPGIVAHTCNPNTPEAKEEDHRFKASLASEQDYLTEKLKWNRSKTSNGSIQSSTGQAS